MITEIQVAFRVDVISKVFRVLRLHYKAEKLILLRVYFKLIAVFIVDINVKEVVEVLVSLDIMTLRVMRIMHEACTKVFLIPVVISVVVLRAVTKLLRLTDFNFEII